MMEDDKKYRELFAPAEIESLVLALNTGVLPSLEEAGNMLTKNWTDPAGKQFVSRLMPHLEALRSAKEKLCSAEEELARFLEESEKQQEKIQ